MRVLYFDPKFLTPRHAAPTRAYSIARHLVERGHEVTMVARDPRWLAVAPTAPPGLLSRRERVDGIDVVWLRVPSEQSFAKAKRLLSYGAYAVAASAAVGGLGRPDLVYASSTRPARRQTTGEALYDLLQGQIAEGNLPSKGISSSGVTR